MFAPIWVYLLFIMFIPDSIYESVMRNGEMFFNPFWALYTIPLGFVFMIFMVISDFIENRKK